MTLHRPRRPYSRAYAERQLALARKEIDHWEGVRPGSDWRLAADKAQALRSWRAKERRWENVLNPPPIERLMMTPWG